MKYESFGEFIVLYIVTIIPTVLVSVYAAIKYLFKKWIDSTFEKSVEKFKAEMQKCVEVTFRDEAIRTAVVTETVVNANKIRLSIYKRLYTIFFKIVYSRTTIRCEQDNKKQHQIIDDIFREINEVRTEIFVNSIYLDLLIDPLLKVQIGLWEDLRSIQNEINGGSKESQRKYIDSSDALRDAEMWIVKNMKTNMVLKHFDLSEDTIKRLHENRTKIIKEQSEQ